MGVSVDVSVAFWSARLQGVERRVLKGGRVEGHDIIRHGAYAAWFEAHLLA